MVFSFDVFDTCLCRLCGSPRNMYDVLSLRVQKMMGDCCTEHTRQLFVTARAQSDGKCLEDIYQQVIDYLHLPYRAEDFVRLELEVEQEMISPIISSKHLVDNLRSKGHIIFISDMYLPENFIREQLIRHGFFKDGDMLYVSNSVGAYKHNGTIYKRIHDSENIKFHQWHHWGDNPLSDYDIPHRFNIHPHLIKNGYLPYEQSWQTISTTHLPYPSILSGISHSVRLGSNAATDQKAFTCDLAAPLMVSWCIKVIEDACSKGIKHLYFCARDAHSYYLITKTIIKESIDNRNLSVHYLFISTTAVNSPFFIDYLQQEGVAQLQEPVAIIDSRGQGYFIDSINQILAANGYLTVYAYILQLSSSNDLAQLRRLSQTNLTTLHNQLYTNSQQQTSNSIGDIGWLLENILSLNYHLKTVGYNKRKERIVPVFSDDRKEISGKSIRTLKKDQDILLQQYASAYVRCGLVEYNDKILTSVIIPTLTSFSSVPKRLYLSFLTRFNIYEKKNTYVHSLFRCSFQKGGHWIKGCIYYTLPTFLAELCYRLYKKMTKHST